MQIDVPLLKVLLVDDEPFILKGLAALIDWETEGYLIAGEATNGKSAIQLLKQTDFDLVISDIKMPEMDGIEFITYVRDHKISNARFVFLSGYYDFQYAKTAIKYGCCDYILKPIQKEELLVTLRKIMDEYQKEAGSEKKKKDYEKAYLDRHLISIIFDKYDALDLKYVQDKLRLSDEISFLHCEISLNDTSFLALSETDRIGQKRRLYNYATLLLKNYANHVIYDITKISQCYDIGFIYCSYMAKEKGLTKDEWLNWLTKELSERVGFLVVACMGSKVYKLNNLADSYREAVMIRSFRFSRKQYCKNTLPCKSEQEAIHQKDDYFKKQLDELVHVIEINDKQKIKDNAIILFRNMMNKQIDPQIVSRNIEFMLYRLLGLAYNQDADINQEEIMQYIREGIFTSKSNQGNELKFKQFVLEYSDYLTQLRQNTAKGIMSQIEVEIEENYAENISLKYLGEKYHINNVYLGQVFKKHYGCAFKDYLNKVRIRKAAEILMRTDKKICEIACDSGYKNQEYFINKFEEIYGMTPTRFRKRNMQNRMSI